VDNIALQERARWAKVLFDSLADWKAPELPGMTSEGVKSAVLLNQAEPVILGMLSHVVPSAERKFLSELTEYRRGLYKNSEMADAGEGKKERVFANLYDALFAHLAIHGEHEVKTDLYRGQRDSRWKLVASYYRALPRDSVIHDDRAKVISSFYGIHVIPIDEINENERALQKAQLYQKYPRMSLGQLPPLQEDAVIQHYLSGTKLLDFTTSIYVAAFFATATFTEHTDGLYPELGAIYRISEEEIAKLAMGQVEAPELPQNFVRIHRQKGVFLKIRFREAINDPLLWARWVFRHTDVAYPFCCPTHGITPDNLLPEEIVEGAAPSA
jgi:hypothetical protein